MHFVDNWKLLDRKHDNIRIALVNPKKMCYLIYTDKLSVSAVMLMLSGKIYEDR